MHTNQAATRVRAPGRRVAGRLHTALVRPALAAAVRSGRKRIETRFSRARRAPYGCVRPGECVQFRVVGGAWVGSALARVVVEYAGLDAVRIGRLARRHGAGVCATADYWTQRFSRRFGVLIRFGKPQAVVRGGSAGRQYGSAWVAEAKPAARNRFRSC